VVLRERSRDNGFMSTQNFAKPQGVMVFGKLEDAVRNGFEVYERTSNGYLVRTRTAGGWAFALVHETRS
jgi:hypothetical protein